MGNQWRGVKLPLLNQPQNLPAVAAIYPAGLEGQVFAVHLRQGEGLRLLIEGHHGDQPIGAGALPRQGKGVLSPGRLQHHVRAAVGGVFPHKPLALLRPAEQRLGVMLLNKRPPGRVLFADDDPPGVFQQRAQQGANPCGARPKDQNRVLRLDRGDPGRPEACGQNIPHKQRLLVRHTGGDPVQPLAGIGHPHIFRLPAVYAAAQGPASVGVGAVVDVAALAEKALAAEGLHIHRHPVARADRAHLAANLLHNAHHLVAHSDAGNGPGHAPVLDVQVAGADGAQRHPDNGVARVLQRGLGLIQQRKPAGLHIGQGFHKDSPFFFRFHGV